MERRNRKSMTNTKKQQRQARKEKENTGALLGERRKKMRTLKKAKCIQNPLSSLVLLKSE